MTRIPPRANAGAPAPPAEISTPSRNDPRPAPESPVSGVSVIWVPATTESALNASVYLVPFAPVTLKEPPVAGIVPVAAFAVAGEAAPLTPGGATLGIAGITVVECLEDAHLLVRPLPEQSTTYQPPGLTFEPIFTRTAPCLALTLPSETSPLATLRTGLRYSPSVPVAPLTFRLKPERASDGGLATLSASALDAGSASTAVIAVSAIAPARRVMRPAPVPQSSAEPLHAPKKRLC
jgi:hypothetical protein